MRPAIDNEWMRGFSQERISSQHRKDGMTYASYLEVEKSNKILLTKMARIMKGNYESSTRREFHSRKPNPMI